MVPSALALCLLQGSDMRNLVAPVTKGAVLTLALLGLGLLVPRGDDVYARVIGRALERAQARLAATLDFEIDHRSWNDPWVVKTEHYEVRATESYTQTFELARSLEALRAAVLDLLGTSNAKSEILKVWVFPFMADYNKFGNDFGEDHSSLLGGFYSVRHPEQPVASYQSQDWLRLWVTHAAVHQLLAKSFGAEPETWIDEGLASYFALSFDWQYGVNQLEVLKKERRLMPLERLVREPLQSYGARANDRFLQLGMLFRYLLVVCEATKSDPAAVPPLGPFQTFLRDTVRGKRTAESEFLQILESDSGLIEDDFQSFDFSKL
jgi:hypothetical protein